MEIKKALTFRASSIGDCLMGKYLLENIHVQFPSARLGIVVGSRGAMLRDLFAAYPWLEIIEANRRSPSALFSLLKNFYGSDLVITQYAGKPCGRFSFRSKLFARVLAKRGGSSALLMLHGGTVFYTIKLCHSTPIRLSRNMIAQSCARREYLYCFHSRQCNTWKTIKYSISSVWKPGNLL